MGVFPSPSDVHMRWKVVRETLSSESAARPPSESEGSKASLSLSSQASQQRSNESEVESKEQQQSYAALLRSQLHRMIELRALLQPEVDKLRGVLAKWPPIARRTVYDLGPYPRETFRRLLKVTQLFAVRELQLTVRGRHDYIVARLARDEAQQAYNALPEERAERDPVRDRLHSDGTERHDHKTDLHALRGDLRLIHKCQQAERKQQQQQIDWLTSCIKERDKQQRRASYEHCQHVKQLEDKVKRQQAEVLRQHGELAISE